MTKTKISKLKKFFSRFPVRKFSKGEIVYKPGDSIDHVYFNKTGFGRLYLTTPGGESTVYLFKPLFTLSFLSFITGKKNNYYLQALTHAEVYAAPYSEFKKFFESDGDLRQNLLEYFFNSLLNYFINQSSIISGNAQNKIASVLLQLSQDYGETKNGQLTVKFPVTHRIIATLVGLTRETTSVQMSKLQKMAIISNKRNHFIVHNLEKLRGIAQTLQN